MRSTYQQLFRSSYQHIENYRLDLLKHDLNQLDNYHGPFIHYTRKSGTHLIRLSTKGFPPKDETVPFLFSHATREELLHGIETIPESITNAFGDLQKVMCFDGENLREVSLEEAKGIIDSWVESVKKQWAIGDIMRDKREFELRFLGYV